MSLKVTQRYSSIEKYQTNQNNENDNQFDLGELEKTLNILRKKYIEMKRERLKNQRDEKLMSNKMRLLSKEEIKVARKQQMYMHTQENIDKIKVNLLQNKEKLDSLKLNKRELLKERKREISKRKNYINITLKSWRSNLEMCRKSECKKTKEKQNEIQEKILLNKNAIRQRHQSLHDKIQMSQKAMEERKKNDEVSN